MAHVDHGSWSWQSWLMVMSIMATTHGDHGSGEWHGSSVFVLFPLFILILLLLLIAIVINRTRSALWLGIRFSSAFSAQHSLSFLLGSLGSALALSLGFSAPHSLSFPRTHSHFTRTRSHFLALTLILLALALSSLAPLHGSGPICSS